MTAGELGAERVALILAGRWREALAQHPGWEDEVVYWLAPVGTRVGTLPSGQR